MFYLMRHVIRLSVILGGLLQLEPTYTAFCSSPPTPSGDLRQSLETRQDFTVVVPSEFLRRGSQGCQ